VIEKYLAQYKELQQLRQQLAPMELTDLTDLTAEEPQPLADIDIYNTTAMTHQQQYKSHNRWPTLIFTIRPP
jgi:hypothetical protein